MQKNNTIDDIDLSPFALKNYTSTDAPAYEFVADNAAKQGMTVSALGHFNHPEGKGNLFLNELLLLNSLREKSLRFSKQLLEASTAIYISNQRELAVAVVRERISITNTARTADDVLKELAAMMALGMPDSSPITPDMAASVMAKTVWQAKRKLHGKRVTNHLMLVFVGEQGGGKTWFAEKFTSPVKDMRIDQLSFSQLTDDRNIEIFGGIIGLMDEMAKAGKADIEELKSIITTDNLTRRPMRSNSYVQIPQRLTFIGTSNKGVDEIIMDETGNRRFFQIDLIGPRHERISDFRAAQANFDWLELWQVIDPDGADPCELIHGEVVAIQEERRSPGSVETWFADDETNIRRIADNDNGFVATTDLFNAFDNWRNSTNNYKMTSQMFSKTLRRLVSQGVCAYMREKKTNSIRGYEIF